MIKEKRPRKLSGDTYEIKTGCGEVYVTVNEKDGKLFEVFVKLGKSGGCGSATMEGLGKAISIGIRCGIDPLEYVKSFKGIQCHKPPSCVDAVACVLGEQLGIDWQSETPNADYLKSLEGVEYRSVRKDFEAAFGGVIDSEKYRHTQKLLEKNRLIAKQHVQRDDSEVIE